MLSFLVVLAFSISNCVLTFCIIVARASDYMCCQHIKVSGLNWATKQNIQKTLPCWSTHGVTCNIVLLHCSLYPNRSVSSHRGFCEPPLRWHISGFSEFLINWIIIITQTGERKRNRKAKELLYFLSRRLRKLICQSIIQSVSLVLFPFLFQVTTLNLEIVRALARGTNLSVSIYLRFIIPSNSKLISLHLFPHQV